jgi:hypothetical protein
MAKSHISDADLPSHDVDVVDLTVVFSDESSEEDHVKQKKLQTDSIIESDDDGDILILENSDEGDYDAVSSCCDRDSQFTMPIEKCIVNFSWEFRYSNIGQ